MNKTIDISLAGILFHLDESAYYKLKKYLKAVKSSLQQTDDVEEVMNEIEARIAELFLEKQTHPQQVINEKNIDEVIQTMGQPEDYEEEVDTTPPAKNKGVKKSLFRDMDHSVLGGIAAGLAHYLNIDITLTRLIFVALIFATHGTIILIYLLLWIVIPKAKTASDKLRMKGEKVNVYAIVDQVSAEENTDKKKIKLGEKVEDTSKELGSVFLKIIGFFIVLVAGLALTGILVSLAGLLPFLHSNIEISGLPFTDLIGVSAGWITILTIISTGVPFVLLLLLGIKMLFPNSKPINSNVFIIAGTIWLLSLIFIVAKTGNLLHLKNAHTNELSKEIVLPATRDTLYISAKELFDSLPNHYVSVSNIRYKFYPSKDSDYHFKIYRYSEGASLKKARRNARKIQYKQLIDSTANAVVFSKNIIYPATDVAAVRKLNISVYVPENALIKLNDEVSINVKNTDKDFPKVISNKNDEMVVLQEYDNLDTNENESIRINGNNVFLKIDDDGINFYSEDENENVARITIDDNGIKIKAVEKDGDSTAINIDDKGINIKNNNNE